MNKHLFSILAFVVGIFIFTACSPNGGMIANRRDAGFYSQFVNPANDYPQAESRISELKVLETDQKYSMRYALFDNGKVYYQIDKLGNGSGSWEYVNGAVVVTAYRPIFDMELTFSAAEADGDKTVVRFVDRYGYNSVPVLFRNPETLLKKQIKLQPLKEFKPSDKNI